ncbi:hypothetical protein OC834_006042 [Tilletia horrida]|nr:hypothetical protein OC834_006042 [Tilletia horrida]
MSTSNPPSPSKSRSARWPTHLAICADFILGTSKTDGCNHEVQCSLYDGNGREHRATLSVWSRDVPWQGLYILVCQAFATHPNRIAIGDVSEMRLVPAQFDGLDRSKPSLPRTQSLFTGIAVLDSVDEDRRSGLALGFTHLDKAKQWQRFTIRIEFEPTSRWNGWLLPSERSLISFDAVFAEFGYADTFKCWIRRISYIDPASPALLRALGIAIPGGGDRADRLRQLYGSGTAPTPTDAAISASSSNATLGTTSFNSNPASISESATVPPGSTSLPAASPSTTEGLPPASQTPASSSRPPSTPVPVSNGKTKASIDDDAGITAEDLEQSAALDIEAMLTSPPPPKVRRTAATSSRSTR